MRKWQSIGFVAIVAIVTVLVVGFFAMRSTEPATALASPTATASPTLAAATPTASATASPTPTAQGVYLSKKLGYALELLPPWHQAICGNSDPVDTRLPANEQFTSAGPMNEFFGDVGSPNDRVVVGVEDNPRRLSPMDFAAEADPGAFLGRPRSVTFAARPAAEVGEPGGVAVTYYVADGDRMYAVRYNSTRSASDPAPDRATMLRIVRSFRFLSASEREALPDPTPIPAAAPTAQALAGMLATAFQQKDVVALERLLSPCVSIGREQAGGSLITRQLFVAGLRTQFANGLTVTVDTNATRTAPFGGQDVTFVRSRWNAEPPGDLRPPPSPRQATQNVDLMLGPTRGGFCWKGTYLLPG